MPSDYTIYSFIICNCVTRMELNNYFLRWLFRNYSFRFTKVKDISGLSEKLKICLNLWRVCNCKNFARKGIKFNFIKINRISTKGNVVSFWVAFALKINLISALTNHFEFTNIVIVSKSWCINNFYPETHFRGNTTEAWLNYVEVIREIWFIIDYIKIGCNLWTVF